jgi:hypothetical protein
MYKIFFFTVIIIFLITQYYINKDFTTDIKNLTKTQKILSDILAETRDEMVLLETKIGEVKDEKKRSEKKIWKEIQDTKEI